MHYLLLLVAASSLVVSVSGQPAACAPSVPSGSTFVPVSGSKCTTCNGTNCTSCTPVGYGLNFTTTSTICSPCGSNCVVCAANSSVCTTCKGNYGPDLKSATSSCSACLDESDHCGYQICNLNGGGSCDYCDDGYILSPNGTCAGCNADHCVQCFTPDYCNTCEGGFVTNINSSSSTYGKCTACPSACFGCYTTGMFP